MKIVGHILILCISQMRRCTRTSFNKTCNNVCGGVQPTSQTDTRSMLQWELCVTEVKIEAQATSGGGGAASPFLLWSLFSCFHIQLSRQSHASWSHSVAFFEAGARL